MKQKEPGCRRRATYVAASASPIFKLTYPYEKLRICRLVGKSKLYMDMKTAGSEGYAYTFFEHLLKIGSLLRKQGGTSAALILLCLLLTAPLFAEPKNNLAIKSNLLYDATTTPNLGIEFGVGRKNTFQLFYGMNPWTFESSTHGDRKAKHWMVMPELRWWTCSKFNGHFFGLHLLGSQFNASNVNIPLPGAFFGGEDIRKGVRNSRYEGYFAGGGFTYGYQWIFGRHWNLEAEIGVGYDHIWYDKYPCYSCGAKIADGGSNYLGVNKLGLSLLYIF